MTATVKQLALVAAISLLAGCGTHLQASPTMATAAALQAQAAKKTADGHITAKDTAAATKIINDDFINTHFEKAPGGGYWIPNPSEEGDGVIVKKVSSGFKNFKFTVTATAGVLAFTADQDCLDQDMDPFTTHCTGTVDLNSKKVTYNFK